MATTVELAACQYGVFALFGTFWFVWLGLQIWRYICLARSRGSFDGIHEMSMTGEPKRCPDQSKKSKAHAAAPGGKLAYSISLGNFGVLRRVIHSSPLSPLPHLWNHEPAHLSAKIPKPSVMPPDPARDSITSFFKTSHDGGMCRQVGRRQGAHRTLGGEP